MFDSVDLGELELAALLCSRVCHDVISPVGAITNGLEVLEDDANGEMRDIALDLIKKSALRASACLQFARLAYGAAGSAGAELDLGELRQVAAGYVGSDKTTFEWTSPNSAIDKDAGRLLLNLLVIAQHAIPRGGSIAVAVEGDPKANAATVRCIGTGARVPPEAPNLIAGAVDGDDIDARSVQPFFAGLLARRVGATVELKADGADIVITMRCATP